MKSYFAGVELRSVNLINIEDNLGCIHFSVPIFPTL